jgi:hypothetical protein
MSHLRTGIYATCLAAILISVLGFAPVTKAQAFSVVYNFGSAAGDPIQPFYSGIIVQGQDGNLYSASYGGGGSGSEGAAFKMTPSGTLSPLVVK